MRILINEEPKDINSGKTVQELLHTLGYETADGIALAINDAVIPRDQWENRTLQPNEQITLIQATQGG